MIRNTIQTVLPLVCVTLTAGADWLHFRGSDNRSVATTAAPVDLAKDEAGVERNVAWKTALPGRGVSSPILVGGKLIVTAASGFNQDRLHVVCIDAETGAKDWERQFWATGRTMCHPTSSVAANTPASDGKRIYAFFSSNDLACLDLAGNLLWYRGLTHDFPTAANDVGMSASPIVLGDTVVVQVENKGDSFAAGLDAETGASRWRIPRPAEMNWTSPAVWRGKTRAEDLVLLQSPTRFTAHDPRSGEQVWSYEVACSTIPSPVAEGDTIYVPSGGLTALRYQPEGKAAEVAWTTNALAPGNASPVVDRGRVYTINGAGVLLCGDATTGETKWKLRLKGQFWATPVIAGDYLYIFNQEGAAQVVKLGDTSGEIVARGDFGEPIFGSPIIDGGAIYVRTDGHLWKIAGH
ncbi:MAG TPA: PQQ-binding-like beta-propeller repeat protein [Pirellulales bacterium]|nr:PQQ-binding-like beta-propeller repeat protein [Pirellulales bacterium]